MATENPSSSTSSRPSRRVSSHSPSPSRPTAAAGTALLLVDAEKAVAFEEARRKFAMYGRQNAHVSHLVSSRKAAASASSVQSGGDTENSNNMKPMRKRAMIATASSADGSGDDDATVLKNTLLLQENGELALHLDDLNYRLDGIAANCGSGGDGGDKRTPEQLYAGAQNVVELTRLLQLQQVQMVIKLASPSQNLLARIRGVIKLLPVRMSGGGDREQDHEQKSLGLAIAVLAFVLTQSPDADEFFTIDILDLIVQCLHTTGDADRHADAAQSVVKAHRPLAIVEEHKADEPMPLKKTCLKRKARPLNRRRSSSVSSGDDVAEQQPPPSNPESGACQEQILAQMKSVLVDQEAFCTDGRIMQDLSVVDVLAVVLHNVLQMDKPQQQQHNHQVSRDFYHPGHRDSASARFSAVLARKRQLIGNQGLDALIHILAARSQHLKNSFLNEVSRSASSLRSFEDACSLRRVQVILRVLDQASFLAVEVQQYVSSKRALFAILLESVDQLSEMCWGTRQASSRWSDSDTAADMHHLVVEVLLVSLRVLINLTHHNEDAAHQIHGLHGTKVLFRAFCKLWTFVEASKGSIEIGESNAKQHSDVAIVFEEKLLFDALLMCLSALTNCIEFSEENREALSSAIVPSGEIDGLREPETSGGVCELLTRFFLSKVQSYLRIIDMSESQGGGSRLAAIENAESLEWIPEDVVLGGCTSLLLGCLMKDSSANSSVILAMLPDGSPRLLLRALSAFVALHSQIGALTPEVGDSVLQVERTLKSFLSEHESGYVTPAEPAMVSQTLEIAISVERVQQCQDVQAQSSLDAASRRLTDDQEIPCIKEKEVHTPPATAFKLQKWKKVCSTVDSDTESGDGDAEKEVPIEHPVKSTRSPNVKGRSPNVRSPSVRVPKKEKKNRKAAISRSPGASPLVLSANRANRDEVSKQTQPSPQRMKRARQLVSELAEKLSKVSDDGSAFSEFSAAMTSTEDLHQQHEDDEWNLDFSRDEKLPPKIKTGKATPPIGVLSRDSSPMTPGARKRARIGKLAHRSPSRSKMSLALTAVATISASQQVAAEDSSQVLDEAGGASKAVRTERSSSFENALKRKRKTAKPPPSKSADGATAVFDFLDF